MKKILSVLALFFALTSMVFAAVNLNSASKDELDAVKGIGPVKAQAIIDYRTQHGPFKSVDDLKNVRGFGDKTVAKMRSDLSVSGASSAPAAKEEKKADKPVKAEDKKSEKAAKVDKKAEKASKEIAEDKKADKKKVKETKEAAAKDGAKIDKKADKKAASEARKAEREAKKTDKKAASEARKAKKKADKEAKQTDKK